MNKKTLYLAIALVVLLVLFFISKVTDRAVERIDYFVETDTTKIDNIHIVSPANGEVTLRLENDAWRVTEPIDFPAEERHIHSLLEKISQMEIENIVSSRPEMQKKYEVDDSSATKLEFKSGDKILTEFYLGKQAVSTNRHTYFRKPGSNDIMMIKGTYKYFMNRKLKDWRNQVILELNPESVEEIKGFYFDHDYTVALRDSVWWLTTDKKEFEAAKKAVDPLLNYLSRLRSGDFYEPAEGESPPDMTRPDFKMEITFDGSYKEGLSLLKADPEERQFYIKKDSDDTIYMVYKGTANVLMKDIEDFRIREEPKRPGSPNEPRLLKE